MSTPSANPIPPTHGLKPGRKPFVRPVSQDWLVAEAPALYALHVTRSDLHLHWCFCALAAVYRREAFQGAGCVRVLPLRRCRGRWPLVAWFWCSALRYTTQRAGSM